MLFVSSTYMALFVPPLGKSLNALKNKVLPVDNPVTSKVSPVLAEKVIVPEEYVPPVIYVLGVSVMYIVAPDEALIVPPVLIRVPFKITI